jgi:hypothetical protein
MFRLFVLGGLLALAVFVSGVQAQDKDTKKDKPKDIGEIMKKAHAGEGAFRSAVTRAIKAKDFAKGADPMKAWVAIATHLSTFDPPKGTKESWDKLTKEYSGQIKDLAKAVDDKDASGANASLKKINMNCGTCHRQHRKPKN